MRTNAKCFDTLRAWLDTVPLVDCHDHTSTCVPKFKDPIEVMITGYFGSDLQSAAGDVMPVLRDSSIPLEERYPVFERAWKRTRHTGYAEVHRRLLKRFYNVDEPTLEALKSMQGRLLDLTDEKLFESILEEANIKVRLLNLLAAQRDFLEGKHKISPRGRAVIPLPRAHAITSCDVIQEIGSLAGARFITSLDEYLNACRTVFEKHKALGAVAFKDQSAYRRSINYSNPPRADAEKIFNWLVEDPRRQASYPDGLLPLSDFLFHEFMRMARDMDLPVQIHTGHMAGIRNDIVKTNAAGLTRLLETHRDVRFDLFHANWPYSGELLYLGKNHPNVAIDFCWANIIDPIYCQNMFKQAISSVPHSKIHGYGTDYVGQADCAWAHASIARDNIAIALADLVEADWFGLDDAKEIAYAWMFGNANEFFRLGA